MIRLFFCMNDLFILTHDEYYLDYRDCNCVLTIHRKLNKVIYLQPEKLNLIKYIEFTIIANMIQAVNAIQL